MERHAFSIYDASAGAGKTFTLVKEYLKILLTSDKQDAYRNILAITFTNKAVGEMKSRIVGSLSEFCKDNPDKKAQQLIDKIVQETTLNAIQIKQKSRQIIKNLIHNYAAFDISTIDKFTHKVIRAFAHDLGLLPIFDVSLETENLLTEAVDALIARAGEDETLTKLLVDFTMEKTDDDKSWDVSREIMETGRLLLNENNRAEIVHFEEKTIPEFSEIKAKIKQAIDELQTECVAHADEILQKITNSGIDPKSFSRGTFPNHIESIRSKKFNPRNKTFHDVAEVAINKTAKDRDIIESLLPEMIATLSCVYKNQEKIRFYEAFLKNITPLSLLNTVSQELARIQKEQNILSIAEFNAIIHKEIQNQPAPFIYERLGEKYRHFFIDEFQDTSEMQWQNLIPLIANSLAGEDHNGNRGSLMIVGDPKQSIYRWRGGKAEQFIELAKKNTPFPHHETNLEHLATNYRSYSEVIEFNNRFFNMLSRQFENEDYKDLYQNKSKQETNDKLGGYVNISFIQEPETLEDEETPEKDELYVKAVLSTIQKVLAKGFSLSAIAILTRKRSHGIAVADFLTENGIAILSSETLMIGNSTEVIFVLDMLRYLNNGRNLEAKAGTLRYIAEFLQDKLPIHDFIAEGMSFQDENLFEKFLNENKLQISFSSLRRKSLYESVELIVSKFINRKMDNAYIQYFLDLVLERDMKNSAGIGDFLSYWDKNGEKFSIPSPEGKDAVKIMTIHKSKGLEFPVVIFPFAEENYSKSPREKLWLNGEENISELPRFLIDKSSAVEGFGDEASIVYKQRKQEDLLDNINVLYVALTRAEEQLFVISAKNISSKGAFPENNMCSFFINYIQEFENDQHVEKFEYEIGNPEKISPEKPQIPEGKKVPFVTDLLQPQAIKIAQREALMWGGKQLEAIEYGNVVHEILSWISSSNDVETALDKAIENALIRLDQKEKVRETIFSVIQHPELEDGFSIGKNVMNEQSIIVKNGTPVKPDRMVFNSDNTVFLIDYKTGNHDAKYVRQLENYSQAIEEMGLKVTKKTLVYIGDEVKVVNL